MRKRKTARKTKRKVTTRRKVKTSSRKVKARKTKTTTKLVRPKFPAGTQIAGQRGFVADRKGDLWFFDFKNEPAGLQPANFRRGNMRTVDSDY